MVTEYPRQLATADTTTDRGVVARAMTRLGQVWCGFGGHNSLLHFEGNRVMMRCTSCGFDTPGWEISGRGPRLRYEGDAHRLSLVKTGVPNSAAALDWKQRVALRKTA